MIYNHFKDKTISALGFGAMRLPCNEDKSINVQETERMVDFAIKSGVNYFDTAYPYHGGKSEIVLSNALSKYPRDSYFLANKYPGHQTADEYNPAEVFEDQLKKCNVDYFDFYLLHNVYENSIDVYKDTRWGIVDYFVEQKKNGRIKHLGFSTHGGKDCIADFLDYCGEHMEFCQIQLNYLDWTLQQANETYEFLQKKGLPIIVMEPVRGGKLANLSEDSALKLKQFRPKESAVSWAFRWLQTVPETMVILSGMSNFSQMEENVATFANLSPLNDKELSVLYEIADNLKNSLPCTACGYCTSSCPMGLNIPFLIERFNEVRFTTTSLTPIMRLDSLPEDKLPSACLSCGACVKMCPQKIDIPGAMSDFNETLSKMPKWADICRQRNEEAKKLRENKK